ncbi:hypothetical protein M422DRAFT_168212, partial [Sphaerobolus stellatus SS14]
KGHICLFLPKFHCELDPIEMVRGCAEYGRSLVSDAKFSTAKVLIPQILDSVETSLIQKFFRKTWRYINAYDYGACFVNGLDPQQVAFAVKIYRSHRQIGTLKEVLKAMEKKKSGIKNILGLLPPSSAKIESFRRPHAK